MLNQSILLAFDGYARSTPISADIAVFFAQWFPYFVVFFAVIYAFRSRDHQAFFRSVLLMFLPALVAWMLADIGKSFFQATRPFAALGLTPLVTGENPLASFPSAHATFFSALGMMIFFRDRKTGVWFLAGAFAIGLARIAVGVHWPSDILAGFLLGGVVALFCHRIFLKFFKTPELP